MINELNSELVGHVNENPEIFDFIHQEALDGLWFLNINEPEHDWVNDKFWRTLGYKGDNAPRDASGWQDRLLAEDLPLVKLTFDKFKQFSEYKCDIVVRFRHRVGKTVWLRLKAKAISNDDGLATHILATFFNVSTEKEKETFLVSCNAAANIGYWEVNLETSDVFWSPVTKNIHGVSSDYEPNIERALDFYQAGESRDLMTKSVGAAMAKGENYTVEVILITADGNEKWVEAIGFAEMNKETCVRLYGTFQDIDKRKRGELEMISLLRKSQAQNKRLQNFKNIVSHNLRSHSGNMEFLIDLLSQDKPEVSEVETFQLLRDASNNLIETIYHLNEVSSISDADSASIESLDLTVFVDKAIANVAGVATDSGVEIMNKVKTSRRILGFPAYLESIVLNFLTNAIKYRSEERKSYVKLYVEENDKMLSLCIEDNGVGIDLERHRDKLFGMYKTFHPHRDSRGIGLFITRYQVEAMEGSIDVQSELGKGTTFKINFKYEKG